MLQPPKNTCTIVAHNSRESLLAVSLVESLNIAEQTRVSQWAIEKLGVFCKSMQHHDIMEHGDVFQAVAVITQISINAGEQLFEVNYSDQ